MYKNIDRPQQIKKENTIKRLNYFHNYINHL